MECAPALAQREPSDRRLFEREDSRACLALCAEAFRSFVATLLLEDSWHVVERG